MQLNTGSTQTQRWSLKGFHPTAEIEMIALFSEGRSLISSLLLEPIVQLLILAAGLQGAINAAGFTGSVSYVTWVLPGLVALQTVRAFSRTMYRTVLDRQWGMLTIKRLAGVGGAGYTLGKVAPSAAALIPQVVVLFILAVMMGSRFSLANTMVTIALALVAALFWAALAVIITGFVRDYVVRDIVVTWVMLPLSMAAPVFYPIETAPSYLRWIARFNPLAYQVDALRTVLLDGTFTTTGYVMIALTIVVLPVAIHSVSHGDALGSQGGR
ncbi:MAG: ABC transporter permease [Thermomicrobiales bacterium]|nr:ABC transporter permease [Thermomicrobiales bacterium]